MDEVGNRLGLGEVEAAVQKGALGEFTGFGMPRPAGEDAGEDLAGDDGSTMATDLDGVLASVRARGAEDGEQHLVDPAFSIDHVAVKHGVGGCARRDRLIAAGRLEAGVSDRDGGLA